MTDPMALASYLAARSSEWSTRIAGAALIGVAGWAAWQWRVDLRHEICVGIAAAVAALPNRIFATCWNFLSTDPKVSAAVTSRPSVPQTQGPNIMTEMSLFEEIKAEVEAELGVDFWSKMIAKLEDKASAMSPEAGQFIKAFQDARAANTPISWVKFAAVVAADIDQLAQKVAQAPQPAGAGQTITSASAVAQ